MLSICKTYCFPLQQWLHEHASVHLYVHCVSCSVNVSDYWAQFSNALVFFLFVCMSGSPKMYLVLLHWIWLKVKYSLATPKSTDG